jgi:NAD dependent epimerase/dehydratase family enzyme
VRAIDFLIQNSALDGVVNLSSPAPLPNSELMADLRRAWGIGIGLPASSLMLEAGAIFLRTETELILKSRRVVPGRLLESGFRFDFADWPAAAKDLVARWRKSE